jgi:multiple sugar transport system substrate-binding protein
VLANFAQQYPNISVKFQPVPNAQYYQTMEVRLAAGTAPDTLMGNGKDFLNFAEKGAWAPVDSYLKRDNVNLDDYFYQPAVYHWQGNQYATPFMCNVTICAYNKTLFQQANAPPPTDKWTWDDLLNTAKQLTKPGQYGVQVDDGYEFNWLVFIWSNGGDYLNADHTKTTLERPETLEAFQWLVDLKLKHKVSPPEGSSTLGNGDPFMTGKLGMYFAGTGSIGNWIGGIKDFEWDLFYPPSCPKTGKRVVTFDTNPYLLVKASKLQDQAWLLMKHLAGPYTQRQIGMTRIAVPPLKSEASNPEVYLKGPPASMKWVPADIETSHDLEYFLNWGNWYNEITKDMVLAFSGEKTVAEAAKFADQSGDNIIANG